MVDCLVLAPLTQSPGTHRERSYGAGREGALGEGYGQSIGRLVGSSSRGCTPAQGALVAQRLPPSFEPCSGLFVAHSLCAMTLGYSWLAVA